MKITRKMQKSAFIDTTQRQLFLPRQKHLRQARLDLLSSVLLPPFVIIGNWQ
jgi:hypothetical protein